MNDAHQGIVEYLRIIFRRKWLIMTPSFLGLVFGVCMSMVLPKEYMSSMKILVEEEKNDNPLLNNIAVSTSTAQRIATIKETMLGYNSLNELIKRLHIDHAIHSAADREQTIRDLQKNIDFKPNGNIIEISYLAPDASQAQLVVKNIVDIFIKRNVSDQNRETSHAIKFIEAQLQVYLGKIKSAEIAQLKDKLNVLLVDSTEMHPQVKALRNEIAKKMEELRAQNLEYTQDARLSSETTNPMITQIQQALANIGQKAVAVQSKPENDMASVGEKDLYKVMMMDRIDSVMARDVNVNESIYNNLLQRLETAKITQRLQSSREGTRYTIIEDARTPLKPASPNMVMVSVIGLLAGLILGFGFVFLLEVLDKSFLNLQEASEYLKVPLLGGIAKIHTFETLSLERRGQIRSGLLLLSVGTVMLMATLLFLNIKNLQGLFHV